MSEAVAYIDDPVVAISIGRTYRPGINRSDLYNCTRGTWKIDKDRANKAHYALAVYQGVIREVFEIHEWLPSGSTEYTRQLGPNRDDGRSEFIGAVAPDKVRDKYIGKRMPERFFGNPIRYYNC